MGLLILANVTYAPAGAMGRPVFDLLDGTGALQPRRLPISRALAEARDSIAGLVRAWSDDAAIRIAAGNLPLDRPLARRREELAALRTRLGDCRPEGDLTAENWLRGSFRMRCERGWLDVTFTLAPTAPPAVQHLTFWPGQPLGPAASALVDRLASLTTTGWEESQARAVLGDAEDVDGARRQLDALRLHQGACRAGAVLEGDGERRFTVRFTCERGRTDVRIATDDAGTRVASLRFVRGEGDVCVP